LLQASSETEVTYGPAATVPVDLILGLQEVSDQGDGRNNSARHRAELMLVRLEEIRTGLLLRSIPRSQLHELAQAARQTEESSVDSALNAVLDDIKLCAKVESEKLGAKKY